MDGGLTTSLWAISLWAGWDEASIGHFFSHLGYDGGVDVVVHPRLLCMISNEQFNESMKEWKIDDAPVKPMMRMTANLVYKTCKFVMGLPTEDVVIEDNKEVAKRAAEEAIAAYKLSLAVVQPPPSPYEGLRKIKASLIIDPADDSTVPAATSSQLKDWYANYKAIKFGEPLPEKEPSPDQISALSTRVVTLNLEPYADFALLTPHGRRMQKELRHRSWLPQEDGSYKPIEVPGPGSFEVWKACWEVYEVILLMLRWPVPSDGLASEAPGGVGIASLIVTPIALEAYLQNFSTLVKENPGCWHLCQRAEDRCRAEHLPRLVRRLEETTGTTPSWSEVFIAAANDDKYWDKEVRRPALRFLATHVKPPSADLTVFKNIEHGNAVKVREEGHAKKKKKQKQHQRGGRGKRGRSPASASPSHTRKVQKGNGKGSSQKHPRKCDDGRYITTREGIQICFAFSEGGRDTCPEPCSKKRAHVCQHCLQPHRTSTCTTKS